MTDICGQVAQWNDQWLCIMAPHPEPAQANNHYFVNITQQNGLTPVVYWTIRCVDCGQDAFAGLKFTAYHTREGAEAAVEDHFYQSGTDGKWRCESCHNEPETDEHPTTAELVGPLPRSLDISDRWYPR